MQNENPHKNHRARLRARFLSSGLLGFAPHNVLELLLFYALKRRDTNPLAHALLARFGSVDAVLSASGEELLSVAGVGEGTVRLLDAFSAVSDRALTHRPPRPTLGTADLLGDYFDQLLSSAEDGEGAVLYLDNALGVIAERRLFGYSVHAKRFSPAALVEEALLCHAPTVAFAHKHKDGLCLPSAEDLDLSRLLRNTLEAAGISFLEHFLIGGGRYTTLLHRHSGECRGKAIPPRSDREEERRLLSSLLTAASLPDDAEALLAAYGSLSGILSATYARHLYEGVSERTATLLLLLGAVHTYRIGERPVPSPLEREMLGRYLGEYFLGVGDERLLALFFDGKGRHLATHILSEGSVGDAPFSCRRLTEAALFSGAVSGVLVHNHPRGLAVPSEEDRAVTALAEEALSGISVELLGHYIVAEGGVFTVL